jgi:hypothetical protein
VYAPRLQDTPDPRTNLWLIGRAALKARNSTPEDKASPKSPNSLATERDMLWARPEPHRPEQWFRQGISDIQPRPGFLFVKLCLFQTSTWPK